MKNTLSRHCLALLLFLMWGMPVRAASREARPVARAAHVDAGPTLDGEVLGDRVWQRAQPVGDFRQTTPDEGAPASQRTEVRILYTDETLYFGVVCYDSDPSSIIVADSRRDSSLAETDSFQIILDTYHDRQNGFVFGTNPAGIEYDAQVSNEGQGAFRRGRQQGGSGGGFNLNWDASWEVRTRVTDIGWSAEFAIPFRTLRFPGRKLQTWGLNFQRNIRRRKERAFWAPLPRQFNLYHLSLAGTVTGLEIRTPHNLKVIPYVVGQVRRRVDRTNTLGDVGADLKYSVTPGLTLDLTYNTDFAQVEVDEFQINLDRFNLFFPEKRPFFLENAGLFAVGAPGQVELFFSRRIGIASNGSPIPIRVGARLSGRLGRTDIGFLNMRTRGQGAEAPSENFTVARVRRELGKRSFVGGFFANRDTTGEGASPQDHNRTFALDGKWGFGESGEVSGFAASTDTPGAGDGQYAFRVGSRWDSRAWLLTANYMQVGDEFNPEIGFLRRNNGYRTTDFLIFHRYRPQHFLGLHEVRPHVSYRGFWNLEGFQQTGRLHIGNHWEWKSGHEIHAALNITREGVETPFEIFPGVEVPAGTYDHKEAQIVAFTNQGAPLGASLRLTRGGFFGGHRTAFNPSFRFRLGETFNTEVSLDRNDIDLPGGHFMTNLGRARVSYSFNPRVFVQALFQYNDRADIWSTNIRFGWLQTANTGVFIVYNDTRGFNDMVEGTPDRSLVVKISRLFDLLN